MAEVFATLGGRALPENANRHVQTINLVDDDGQPVTVGGAASAASPQTAATPTAYGVVMQASYVDPSTGTVADIVSALVAAGIMAAS